jgi:predicted LPLAT superfamily acyltransferase
MRWNGQTGGTKWMQQALVVLFKYVDIRIMYAVMSIWLMWYVLVRPAATKAIYQFHHIRRKRTVLQSCIDTYRSFYNFGEAIMDRFAVYSGYQFKIDSPQKTELQKFFEGKDSFYVLFSHLGNSEMAGYCLNTPNKVMNILMYMGDTETVMQNRTNALARNNLRVIPMQGDMMSYVLAITEAIEKGEIVALAIDRIVHSKSIECQFMEDTALFPMGPFRICTAVKQSVLYLCVTKSKWNTYRVDARVLNYDAAGSKAQQTKNLAQAAACALEEMAYKHPYQWFNFYDFWAKENE